jgi:hypothetical protein
VHTVATVHTSSPCGCDMGPSEGGITMCRDLETQRAYKSRSAGSTERRIKTRRTSQERVHGGHGAHRAPPFFLFFSSVEIMMVCVYLYYKERVLLMVIRPPSSFFLWFFYQITLCFLKDFGDN